MGSVITSAATSTKLRVLFLANNSSNDLLTCSSDDGNNWVDDTRVGVESSGDSPAVAVFQDQIWVAFTSNESSNKLLVCSSADGLTWSINSTVGQSSKTSPALCAYQGKLWLAFIADSANSKILVCHSADGKTWSASTETGQASTLPPSLCVFNDKLYLAFASAIDKNTVSTPGINRQVREVLICSSSNGTTWTPNTKVNETTKDAPSLCAFNNKLWLAFLASGDTASLLITSSSDGTKWDGNRGLNQSSKKAPSLSAVGDKMYVAFLSNNSKNDILICSSANGASWSDDVKLNQQSWSWPALFAQQFKTGTLRPRYQVATILYAPPGTTGGGGSQVQYADESSAGTTTSLSNTVKLGYEVTTKVGDDKATSGSGSFSSYRTTTDTSTLDVKKSKGTTLTVYAPKTDGIDHDQDIFAVCLNPLQTITVDNWRNVTWSMGIDGSTMVVQYLKVAYLKDPSLMPPSLKAQLEAYNMTPADYAEILKLNPLATSGATIDPDRYMPTGYSFSYLPPDDGGVQIAQTLRFMNSISTSQVHQVQVQNTVTAKFTQGMPGVLHFTEVGSMQWGYTNTFGASNTQTQTAQATVTGPKADVGQATVLVYWDTIFNTFMFAFPTSDPATTGTVQSVNGAAAVHKQVTLTMGDKTYTTTTDAQGNYRFYDVPEGQASVSVGEQKVWVSVHKGATKATIKLTS